MYADAISMRTEDLIHNGALEVDDDGFEVRPDDLYEAIATQTFYLQPLLLDSQEMLYAVR